MRILGYGEDALTYWALSQHMTDVIGRAPLNDGSPPEQTLFIYRPSFGRAGGDGSAQFGEFDAIVATPKAVYLIESKWTGEPIINGQVILAGRQTRRHDVFRWIREQWLAQGPVDWGGFYTEQNRDDFGALFNGKPLAPPGSRLASNLQYVLHQLPGHDVPTEDVLLYFRVPGGIVPQGVAEAPSFVVVPFVFESLNPEYGGRMVDMQV